MFFFSVSSRFFGPILDRRIADVFILRRCFCRRAFVARARRLVRDAAGSLGGAARRRRPLSGRRLQFDRCGYGSLGRDRRIREPVCRRPGRRGGYRLRGRLPGRGPARFRLYDVVPRPLARRRRALQDRPGRTRDDRLPSGGSLPEGRFRGRAAVRAENSPAERTGQGDIRPGQSRQAGRACFHGRLSGSRGDSRDAFGRRSGTGRRSLFRYACGRQPAPRPADRLLGTYRPPSLYVRRRLPPRAAFRLSRGVCSGENRVHGRQLCEYPDPCLPR